MYAVIALVVIAIGWMILKPKQEVKSGNTSSASSTSNSGGANDALIAATIGAAIAASEDEVVAAITAALAFHGISGGDRIIAIRPLGNNDWKVDARSSAVHFRNQMF